MKIKDIPKGELFRVEGKEEVFIRSHLSSGSSTYYYALSLSTGQMSFYYLVGSTLNHEVDEVDATIIDKPDWMKK